jgi:hypothetical protein
MFMGCKGGETIVSGVDIEAVEWSAKSRPTERVKEPQFLDVLF